MEAQERQHSEPIREACLRFDLEVSAYLEGEARPEVAGHASECAACGAILADLQAIAHQSGSLELVEPPARVWTNIRAALAAEGVIHEPRSLWQRWLSPLALLGRRAPVTALAGLVVLAVFLTLPRQSLIPSSPSAAALEPSTAAITDTLADMEKSYQSRKTSLEPGVQATYEKSLASLDHSISECKDSVERDPNNTLAREYLVSAYEQKAQVLSTALEYDSQ